MKNLKSLILKTNFFLKGLSCMFTLNIMDDVIYQYQNDIICFINQGRCYPYYDLVSYEKLKDGEPKYIFNHIHKKHIHKVMTFKNIFGSVKMTYRFYMGYWYEIFMREIPTSKCFIVSNKNWIKYKKQ